MSRRKPKEPELEEDDDEKVEPKIYLSLGDMEISSSKGSLLQAKKLAESLLSNKKIRNYLDFYKQKKMFYPSNYIG